MSSCLLFEKKKKEKRIANGKIEKLYIGQNTIVTLISVSITRSAETSEISAAAFDLINVDIVPIPTITSVLKRDVKDSTCNDVI